MTKNRKFKKYIRSKSASRNESYLKTLNDLNKSAITSIGQESVIAGSVPHDDAKNRKRNQVSYIKITVIGQETYTNVYEVSPEVAMEIAEAADGKYLSRGELVEVEEIAPPTKLTSLQDWIGGEMGNDTILDEAPTGDN